MFKRKFITSVIGALLGVQCCSNVMAEPVKYVLLAKAENPVNTQKVFVRKPKSEWGWWSKFDWQSYQRSGISSEDMHMLKMSAEHGNAQAQYVLGMIYSEDDNVDKAIDWLGKAASQGHASAKFTYNYYMNDQYDEYGLGC